MLIAKFPRRKNIRRGCISRHPCRCDEGSSLARVLSPVHRVWPRIILRTPARGFLFHRLTATKSNIQLKRGSMASDLARGEKFASRCFRRGATQDLLTAGPATATSRGSGRRWGVGFKAYIDTQMADALKISPLLDKVSDSESETEDGHSNLSGGDPIREKIRPLSGIELRFWPQYWRRGPVPWVFNISVGIRRTGSKSDPGHRLPPGTGRPRIAPTSRIGAGRRD